MWALLLYATDRDLKFGLAYIEFANKKVKDDCKLDDRFKKKDNPESQNRR